MRLVDQTKAGMELLTGFLLWLADILGMRWVKQEKGKFRRGVRAVVFLLVGVILVMIVFVLSYH